MTEKKANSFAFVGNRKPEHVTEGDATCPPDGPSAGGGGVASARSATGDRFLPAPRSKRSLRSGVEGK
ncbi:MAG: hypothetical protein PHY34_00650 [Patescibacteria group bacterium]|nr:hypothetical protein [Patescibacteria group bacterium]MDD5715862.1 hypothetical protein [Patescibacteria group bacterium]